MNKNRAGLTLGIFLGTVHLLWSILVATGTAQVFMDFIFRMHFLSNPYQVGTFDFLTALGLVVLTALVGYVAGWVLALLWAKIGSKK